MTLFCPLANGECRGEFCAWWIDGDCPEPSCIMPDDTSGSCTKCKHWPIGRCAMVVLIERSIPYYPVH